MFTYDGRPATLVRILALQGVVVGYTLMFDGPSQQQTVFSVSLNDPALEVA